MEISSNLMLQIQDFKPKKKHISFVSLCERFSEKTSSWSDPSNPFELWLDTFEVTKYPSDCISLLLVISFCRPGWSSYETIEKLINHIWFLATKAHGSQGKWMIVREMLSQDFYRLGIRGCLQKLAPHVSEQDLFGNYLKKAYRILENEILIPRRMIKAARELSKREKYRGIKRKVRRRGYDDKGSLRPSHKGLIEADDELLRKEIERLERESRLPQLKVPPPRYWFKSQFPGSD